MTRGPSTLRAAISTAAATPASLVGALILCLASPSLGSAHSAPEASGSPPASPRADDTCLTATPPAITKPSRRIRFGITPRIAGTVGSSQGSALPNVPAKRDRALRALKPKHRVMVVRLNRLFESDGKRGIERFVQRAHHYAKLGYKVESQVRYHPKPSQEGDMGEWRRFVRLAARKLGRNHSLVALTITNEVNLPISANTSDGAFDGAEQAIVDGTLAARHELNRIGRRGVKLGFSYAYRFTPTADVDFFNQIGQLGGREFRRATDYVGVQLYPGLFYPPVLTTQTAGQATLEALTLVRSCFMPHAHLGNRVRLWVTENGFATNLGHDEVRQESELRDTVKSIHRYSGTLGVSDYRYFNLRDNRPDGTDLFDDVGLVRSDYTRKPAFAAYGELVRKFGTRG